MIGQGGTSLSTAQKADTSQINAGDFSFKGNSSDQSSKLQELIAESKANNSRVIDLGGLDIWANSVVVDHTCKFQNGTVRHIDQATNSLFRLLGSNARVMFEAMTLDGRTAAQVRPADPSENVFWALIDHRISSANPLEDSALICENMIFKDAHYAGILSYGDSDNDTPQIVNMRNSLFIGGADGVDHAGASDWIPSGVNMTDGGSIIGQNDKFVIDPSEYVNGRCAVRIGTTQVITPVYCTAEILNVLMIGMGYAGTESIGGIDAYVFGEKFRITGESRDAKFTPFRAKANCKGFDINIISKGDNHHGSAVGLVRPSYGTSESNYRVRAHVIDGSCPNAVAITAGDNNALNNPDLFADNVRLDAVLEGFTGANGILLDHCRNPVVSLSQEGGLHGINASNCTGTLTIENTNLKDMSGWSVLVQNPIGHLHVKALETVQIEGGTQAYGFSIAAAEITWKANQPTGRSGGIFDGFDSVDLSGSNLNTADVVGYGLRSSSGTVTMNGGRITRNGGISVLPFVDANNVGGAIGLETFTGEIHMSGTNLNRSNAQPTANRYMPIGSKVRRYPPVSGASEGWMNEGTLTAPIWVEYGVAA